MWEVKLKTYAWTEQGFQKVDVDFEFDTFEEAGVFCDMVINHSNIDTFEIRKKG